MIQYDSPVEAIVAQLKMLDDLTSRIAAENHLSINLAMESEPLLGHNVLLINYFSSNKEEMKHAMSMETIMESVVDAFKLFINKIIELFIKMADWMTGKLFGDAHNSLTEVVQRAYRNLPSFNYASFNSAQKKSGELEAALHANEQEWIGRLKPFQVDLMTGGQCFVSIADAANVLIHESVVPKYDHSFQTLQKWEDKSFHEAIDLDTTLIRKTKDEAAVDREAYAEKVKKSGEDELNGFDPTMESLKNSREKVLDCKSNIPDVPDNALEKMRVDNHTIDSRINTLKVPEFVRLQKDQGRTLQWVVTALKKVQNDINNGEGAMQRCFQSMRAVYVEKLTKLTSSGRMIQETFMMVSGAFSNLLECEVLYVSYQMSRCNILIRLDQSNAETWRAELEAWKERREHLSNVLNLI